VDGFARQVCLNLVSKNDDDDKEAEGPSNAQSAMLSTLKNGATSTLKQGGKTDSIGPTSGVQSGQNSNNNSIMHNSQAASYKPNKSEMAIKVHKMFKGYKVNKWFDNTILVLILLSSLSLAFDNPLNDPESAFSKTMFYIDCIFTFAFFIECAVKVIAVGFLFNWMGEEGRTAYIRSSWNILDFVVVVASLVDFFVFVSG
jgi:hypothetical protein